LALPVAAVGKGKGSFRSSRFGNMVTKTSSWEFDADVTPCFVDGAAP
jgi:hypothetical protein